MERQFVPALWIEEINTPFWSMDIPLAMFCKTEDTLIYFPTASPSLFCLLTLVPLRVFLSDL